MPNCTDNNLDSLAACFKQQAAQGFVIIDNAWLSAALTQVLGADELKISVTGPQSIQYTPGVWLQITGQTTGDFLSLNNCPLCLVFFLNDTQVVFQMRVTLGASWLFGDSFPTLAGQAADNLSAAAAVTQYLYVSTCPVAQAMPSGTCPDANAPAAFPIEAGVSFWGSYNAAGPLTQIVALMGEKSPVFQLYGVITWNNTPAGPLFDLQLQNKGFTFSIPGKLLTISNPTVGLAVDYVSSQSDPKLISASVAPYFSTTVSLGSFPLELRADFWGSSDSIDFYISPENPQQASLGDLVSLIGSAGHSQLQALVNQQTGVGSLLNAIAFKQFHCLLLVGVPPTLASASVLIGTIGYDPLATQPPALAWRPFSSIDLEFAFDCYGVVYTPTTNAVVMAELQATAWYRHGGGDYYSFTVNVSIPEWTISGFFSGTLDFNLSKAVSDLTGNEINLPDDLLDFAISKLNFSAAVKQKLFTFHAVVNGTLFGSDVLRLIDTSVGLTIDASGSSTSFTGTINGILALGGIEFSVDATISNDPKTDTTLTIHLVNETVGSMLNHLVHLVDPTYDISLGEPWDKLLDISLDAFVLQITLPPKGSDKGATVSLSYNTSIDLGFIDIKSIALTYSKSTTAASSVKIELEGTFLGQAFGTGSSNPPLGWDALNDQPPSVPGKGNKVFDLEYVGLGQHIAFPDPQPTTIADVMKRLHDSVVPAQPGQLPEFGGKDGSLMFSQDSNWLIGAQFTVMDTLAISAIFNDPDLYGILIQLSGAKAKIFAGLSFEILYRKVTDTIGVYHIELKLPDAMRNLQFGEVSITLPVIILDIYTNGNFRVDFGFPTGLDFSNSFSIQVFPFVGFGGFYFALLDGATSSRVPKITNGNFSPVIEFGVALSLGVGKTIDEGILSGGITVTVIGILQGVLGWFNPTQPAAKEEYFWFQGSISIVGRLYATINFAIISASLDVTAYATVTLTIESHQPIYIELSAGVSVTLSVKILFFTIHLSFSATVHASFTIGSATPTPWILADGGGGSSGNNDALQQPRGARALAQGAPAPALPAGSTASGSDGPLRQLRGQQTLHSTVVRQAGFVRALRTARIAAVLAETPPLTNWPAMLVLPQIETLSLRLLPSFTKSETGPSAVDAILLLTAENSIDPQAVTLNEHRALFGAAPETAAFNLLMEAMLLWAIQAQTGGQSQVSADDLESLQQQLKNPDTTAAAFDYTTLTNFLAANFVFDVTTTSQWTIATAARAGNVVTLTTATPHGLAVGDTVNVGGVTDSSFNGQFQLTSVSVTTLVYSQTDADAESSGGTVDETGGVTFFPMVPAVKLSDTAGLSVDFSTFNLVDVNYQAKAAAYFQLLQTQFQQRNNGQGNDDEALAAAALSVATVIFAHYFNMLMTAGIKAAIDLLHSYAYTTPADNGQSIGDIAGALDPTLLSEPLRIVSPNQDQAVMAQGAIFNLPNVVVQVRSGDTPASLAKALADHGALNTSGQAYTENDLLAANAGVGIFTPGLAVTFSGLSYTTQTNDTLNMIAVRLLLRLASSSIVNSVVGLGPAVELLQQNNPGITDPNRPLAAFIATPAGAVRKNGLTTITTLTPHGLADGDAVTIQGVTDASFNGNVSAVEALTLLTFTYQQTGLPDSSSGNGVATYPQPIIIPNSNSYTVAPGDSLTLTAVYSLAFSQGVFDVTGFLAQVQQLNGGLPSDPTQPLTAGTVIKFPRVVRTLATGDSINTLATALLATTDFVQTTLAGVPAATQLLAPQAVLHVPLQYPTTAKSETNDGDTFNGIAAKFDLTLQEVATQAVNVAGLFATQQSLTISDLPQISVPTLLSGLLNQAEWNNAAGQVSRFLLSGLRLPDPNDKYFQGLTLTDMSNPAKVGPIKTLPLYELTGQQYVLPATNLGTYQITLADQAQVPWLQLNGSGSATFGLTADQQSLISTIAANPITPNVQTLTRLALYQMTPPRIALQHHIAWQAATLPGGCLSGGGGAAGNPSLWLFPDSLVQQIEQAGALNTGSLLYELVAAKHHDPGQPVTAAEANCYAWATIVDFEIALPAMGQPTPSVSNAYVVNGADDTGAALLQQIQQYLTENPRTLQIAANGAVRTGGATPVTTITTASAHGLVPGAQVSISGVQDASFNGAFSVASVASPTTFTYAQPGQAAATSTGGSVSAPALAELYLLYSPDPASGNPSGLVSDQLNTDASYLLKTNLSTLTHSGGGNFAEFATTDPTGTYAARLGDPADFLALLWEASITRNGGFYLSYFNQSGNAALRSSVFGTSSTATLSLLVLLDAQASSKDSTTLPFNNCAIVGDNIDTSTTTLFVQPALYTVVSQDSLTSATNDFNQVWDTNYSVLDVAGFNQDVPLLMQVGATLTIPNQNPYTIGYGDTLASIVKKQLPSGSLEDLLNAGANATSPILATGAAMQFANGILQPAATVPQGTLGFELTRTAPDPNADVVDTLFNLIGYAIEAAGPFLQSGAGLPTTPADSWQAQTDGLTPRALHDEVPTQWFYHQTLVVNQFATHPQGSTSAALPAAQNNPYNAIGAGNQLNEVTLKLQLQDIFGNSPAAAALNPLPVPVGYFDTLNSLASWPSLAVSYEVAGVSGAPRLALNLTMQQARYIPSAAIPVAAAQAAVTADLASYQGIYYQMGQPDLTFTMETSLDTQTSSYALDKTPFFAFAYGAYVYLAALATMQQVTPTLSGATKVSDLWDQYGVSAAQLFDANQNTLVTNLFDAALAVPQMYATVQSDSLQSIVNNPQWQSFHLTVPGLAVLNKDVGLGAGVDLSAPATRTVAATATDSLNSVAQRAHAAVAAVGVANASTAGLWRQGAVLTLGTKQYTMGANDKLADAAKALNVTVEALAVANQWLTNLFAGNVTLQVNDIAISDGDTLAGLAQLVSSDVPTLANANANVPNLFAPATEIQIGPETQPAPPSGTDTLASYAATNHVTLAQLGQANLATAFRDSAQPLIPGALQQTNAPQFCTYVAASVDTIDSVAAKFGTTAANLTALNQGLPGLLNGNAVVQGGRWICPPMQADAHGLNNQQTLKGLATAYNILTSEGQPDVVTLAEANAATLGLLAAQLPLPQWGLTTSENETLNSLVNRLAAKNILNSQNTAYTVSDVALALAETPNLINPAAVVTPVPPVALNSNEVAITPHFTQAVFPLAVNVTTTRDGQWVDPDFANVTSVFQAVTSIRPEPDQAQESDTNAPFTFNQFAKALQTAIEGLFVATGSPAAEGDSPNASTFWAVNLGNAAGPQLSYQFKGGDTEYFALPPLSTSLQGGTVNIKPYVSGQTPPLSGPEQAQTFKAVDMDVWLDTFLQGIDLFLSPAYAVPAYALSPDDVTSVITDKKGLAQNLSQLVTWVLQGPQQTSLHDAQAAMQQALLTQLSSAFTVDTLVQVPVTVTSNTADPLVAPRLSGKVGLAGGTSQQLPNAFSFSTAKVGLTNGAATATFLFSVKAPASSKDAALGLQYNVTELELPDPHAVIGDYEGSSWLKFLQPLPVQFGTSSSLIGNIDIPIPLRAYPSPLLMVAQTATASYQQPSNTDDLVRWDATTTWAHQDADQDEIALRMEVATSDPGALNRTLDTTDSDAIFAALAQFIAVWPAVSNDLARLTTRAPGAPPDPIASGALAAFRMMVDAVTTKWPAALLAAAPRPAAENVAAEIVPGTYEYTLRRQLDNQPDLSTLTVIANAANPATLWPEFAVDDGSGKGMQPLTLTSSTSSQAIYTYPANVPKGQSLTYSLTLPKLDVVMIPDFELSASVTRNADLVSTPTNSLFIYSTPYIGFPSPLVPLLTVGEDFSIGSGSTQQLEAALTAFLEGLLDRPTASGTKRTLRVAGSYGYQITQGGVTAGAASAVRGAKSAIAANKVELVPRLPIVLVPTVELEINGDNNASIAAFAKNLGDFIVKWDGQVLPSHTNASLFFDVCLFSANPGSNNKPLLIVSSVQYSLE